MRAYAVLQGGGVKGAALAGALSAAQQRGIEFHGYGGASAGAVIAALFATGYRGEDVREMLQTTAHPLSLLDEEEGRKTRLDALLALQREVITLANNRFSTIEAFKFWFRNKQNIDKLKHLSRFGLYSGSRFTSILESIMKGSPRGRNLQGPLTFSALRKAGAPALKIVASNLSTGKAKIFDSRVTPDVPVVSAVRASMSYPLVFEPYMLDGNRLVDGGMVSNLPVFLFKKEYLQTGIPIIGIELAEPRRADDTADYDASSFLDDLASCVLEAGDRLFRDIVDGVEVMTIELENKVGTFNFSVDSAALRAMFDWGQISANKFLNGNIRFNIVGRTLEVQKRILQALFASPRMVDPILWAIKRGVQEHTRARNVRVNLALPLLLSDSTSWLRCYGLPHSTRDTRVELPMETRAIDASVEASAPVIIDFSSSAEPATHARQRSAIYFPIVHPDPGDEARMVAHGVLEIQSDTPLLETGWVTISEQLASKSTGAASHLLIDDNIRNLGATWTAILFALRNVSFGKEPLV